MMDNENNQKTNVDKYVDLYETIKERVEAPDVAVAILQEIAKDRRLEKNRPGGPNNAGGRSSMSGSSGPAAAAGKASANQLRYLERLGVDADPNISKKEASRLIDEAKRSGQAQGA